jgi:hypothetical protein
VVAAGDAKRKTSKLGWDITPMTEGERQAAASSLNDASRRICLGSGTEPAFTGSTINGYRHDNKADGIYVCALGGLPLFDSKTKFDSGTGCGAILDLICSPVWFYEKCNVRFQEYCAQMQPSVIVLSTPSPLC